MGTHDWCPDCAQLTGGNCGKHGPTIYSAHPAQIERSRMRTLVSDKTLKVISDYGPELRRIADAMEQIARALTGRVRLRDLPDVPETTEPDPDVEI